MDLLVLEIGPNYAWALLGYPQRDDAWVVAREPRMDDAMLAALVKKFCAYDYDPMRLQRVPRFSNQQTALQ